MPTKNPFEFGRELSSVELVDREQELGAVVRTMEQGGRLFLIGPRRFGKTSILRVAAEQAEAEGIVVLRYDAEAYPTLRLLAEAVVAEAAGRLTGPVERAGKKLREFFGALRPQISFNPLDNTFSASITTEATASEAALLTSVLDGLDRMAADAGRRVAVVIDEFQQVIEQGGSDRSRRRADLKSLPAYTSSSIAGDKPNHYRPVRFDQAHSDHAAGSYNAGDTKRLYPHVLLYWLRRKR